MSTKQAPHTRRLAAALALHLLAPSTAQACTSFRAISPSSHILMAKNYDWEIADGYVVAMPKGMRYRAVDLGQPAPLAWTSAHTSLAFTQFAVGLTISGMNDAGLAVETLVDATGVLTPPRPAKHQTTLVSLQWVQYQLDTASSVADVVASLGSVAVEQMFIPVHFMACDATGDCAVIETGRDGAARVTHRASRKELSVLTNRDWSIDANDVKTFQILPSLSLARSSANRFREASDRLAEAAGAGVSVGDAFRLLEDVRMPFITRWQIVWDLSSRTAYWRNRDGESGDKALAQIKIADLPATCGGKTVLAAPLGSDAPEASFLAARRRAEVDSGLNGLFKQSMRLISLRSGGKATRQLTAAVAAMRAEQVCP